MWTVTGKLMVLPSILVQDVPFSETTLSTVALKPSPWIWALAAAACAATLSGPSKSTETAALLSSRRIRFWVVVDMVDLLKGVNFHGFRVAAPGDVSMDRFAACWLVPAGPK